MRHVAQTCEDTRAEENVAGGKYLFLYVEYCFHLLGTVHNDIQTTVVAGVIDAVMKAHQDDRRVRKERVTRGQGGTGPRRRVHVTIDI